MSNLYNRTTKTYFSIKTFFFLYQYLRMTLCWSAVSVRDLRDLDFPRVMKPISRRLQSHCANLSRCEFFCASLTSGNFRQPLFTSGAVFCCQGCLLLQFWLFCEDNLGNRCFLCLCWSWIYPESCLCCACFLGSSIPCKKQPVWSIICEVFLEVLFH